jgi:N-acetylmuramoyl-L-alanine amidase
MKYTWLIDSGHGGSRVNGDYITAPAKMFEHSPEEIFYEGVFNRQIKTLLMGMLWEADIHCIDVCPTEEDVPLSVRVDVINSYYKKYKNAVLISLHSNAGGGRGFEIWTSYGQTRSDKFAGVVGAELVRSFPGIKFRSDTSDGDIDKEAAFYILKYTHCPAILPECLFFDNYEDYKLLSDPEFRINYAQALNRSMQKAEIMNI